MIGPTLDEMLDSQAAASERAGMLPPQGEHHADDAPESGCSSHERSAEPMSPEEFRLEMHDRGFGSYADVVEALENPTACNIAGCPQPASKPDPRGSGKLCARDYRNLARQFSGLELPTT